MNTSISTPIVQVKNVKKVYPGGVEALNDISLDFPEGKLTTLLGPSGCGKTTLLKIIAGLLEPSSGEVLVDGRHITGPGPERAFVFQDFALMPWATVIRNAAFGLELAGVNRSEREAVAEKYLNTVGLKGFENKYPHELSGGMRQRVGLARALAVSAKVLLMDEPFSAVDEQTRRKFQEDMLSLVKNEQKTFIFVTHSIEEAVYVSDRIVLLPGGVVWFVELKTARGRLSPWQKLFAAEMRRMGMNYIVIPLVHLSSWSSLIWNSLGHGLIARSIKAC